MSNHPRRNTYPALTNELRRKKLSLAAFVHGPSTRIYERFWGLSMRPIISLLAIAILGLGVLTACNSAEWRTARTSPVVPAHTAPQLPADGARRITATELNDLLAKNEAVVIDVRNEASYNAGHIRGAKLIPEAEVANRVNELPRNQLVVTYCS
jgi:hypothetical protein